ncbi:MAG: TonB-dependent receptor [Nevskia sp.]|nr:TonB-dependent receptor [Nevskia sp.]
MKLSSDARIRRAIYLGFAASAACIASPVVQAQDTGSTKLQGVEVTGSRIRSVDAETSNPVFVLDRKAIQATGATTLGDLLQSIPAAAGTITNPQVNNGGGNGGASVNLRGLGAERTLVLLDGRRIIGTTFSDISYVDLDSIPINMVDRIEVLKEGASAVYGSDAIGGVVNIITRKNFKGGEIEGTWGETVRGDGMHDNVNVTYGVNGPKGRAVFGMDFDRNDAINAGRRAVTSQPTAYYYNQIDPNAGTSSRVPTGKFSIPGGFTDANGNKCGSVTRITGTPGTTASQFRCFVNNAAPGPTDRYNFLPENDLLTPAKRYGLFGTGSYDVTPDIQFYGNGFFMHVTSNAQLAPEPFDNGTVQAITSVQDPTSAGPIPISGKSMYNPFGSDIGTYALRATIAGDRLLTSNTETYQGTVGLKGELLDRFEWDVGFTYGRIDQTNSDYGYLNFANLKNELGPSGLVGGIIPRCLDSAGNVIGQCTPVDIFGTTGATLKNLAVTANTFTTQDQSQVLAMLTGDLFPTWAGEVGSAFGFEYRSYHFDNVPDALEQQFALSEANSQITSGTYNVREIFGEFRVPLLKDVPFVKSLDITPGVRYSDYSSFGSTVNAKYGMEYRPYGDLMIRATYTDVFRAPTVNDLFKGALQDSPGFTDPCNGYGSAANPRTPNLDKECGSNVPTDGSFKAANVQASAVRIGNPNLQPERGFAIDFGAVFSPSFYKPLSVELDFYRYKISNDIGLQTTQSSANSCKNFGTFCDLAGGVNRDSSGNMNLSIEPTNNLGFTTTSGIDGGFRLNYAKTQIMGIQTGNFVFTTDVTYLQSWKTGTVLNGQLVDYQSLAGQTDGGGGGGGNGSFPRFKATFAMYWNMGPWSATIYDRYLGNVREGSIYFNGAPDSAIDVNDAGQCGTSTADVVTVGGSTFRCRRQVGDNNYVDISGTYKYARIGTSLTLGITDLFDAKAKFMASDVLGGGTGYPTDPSFYDFTGRAYYAKLKFEFK